jgi:hypothetical protein
MQYTSLQAKPYSNSRCPAPTRSPFLPRPTSRNGKYTNGLALANGGYPSSLAYSPGYSNGITSSLGRPAPAVYQPPATPR